MSRISLLVLCFVSLGVTASPDHKHAAPAMPKEFDVVKQLVGTWEGKSTVEGKEESVAVVYELTSGGTVVMERLMPGTPQEMVSVYHRDGKTLGMTHYCALGNQPHMTMEKGDAKTLSFAMKKPIGIDSMKEPHMHALTLYLDGDTLRQEWTHFEGGKKKSTAIFAFTRKKS